MVGCGKPWTRHVIIFLQFSGESYVNNRNCLLRGLTLHQSGREPDGRIAEKLRASGRIGGVISLGRGQVRGQRERAVDLFQITDEASRGSGRDR